MKRRDFFSRVAGVVAAAAVAPTVIPESVAYAHTDYGRRGSGIGAYHQWRGYDWWIDERRSLRWARVGEEAKELDFVYYAGWHGIEGFQRIAGPFREQLWLIAESGWLTFEFDGSPSDNTARLVLRRTHGST